MGIRQRARKVINHKNRRNESIAVVLKRGYSRRFVDDRRSGSVNVTQHFASKSQTFDLKRPFADA